jgi:hypothetical protein
MEHLIREFGAWLKQGFGWLVDVIVFGCLWGISQVSRLLGTQVGSVPLTFEGGSQLNLLRGWGASN